MTVEPFLAFVSTLGVGLERRLNTRPSVGLGVLAGIGASDNVTIGENVHWRSHFDETGTESRVDFARLHAGLQANMYLDRPFSGPHAGIELTFKHFFASDGGDVSVVTASPYLGWKWLNAFGFTVALRGGLSLAYANNFRDGEGDRHGWYFDRRGTLEIAHLFVSFMVGWSF